MDSGIVVIREKGLKINKYILKMPNQTDQTYENFGISVPEAISKILNIRKIELDKDDSLTLNLSSQLESLFMFNRSGSQKAKVLGRLSGAHFLDYALRSLGIEKRGIGVEKGLKAKELDDLKIQHANLSKIYDFAPTIMSFISADTKIEENRQRLEGLKDLFRRSQDWKRRYTSELQRETILGHARVVEITPVEASVQRLKQLKQLSMWKNDLTNREIALNSYKIQLEIESSTATQEYLNELSLAGLCPTCYTEINSVKLEEIKNNLIGITKVVV
jgi:DNA repair protein SbcC/Rad50